MTHQALLLMTPRRVASMMIGQVSISIAGSILCPSDRGRGLDPDLLVLGPSADLDLDLDLLVLEPSAVALPMKTPQPKG